MTPEAIRTPGAPLETSADLDLLVGLWQEALFARLPADAPPELHAYVQDIENPSRVYAIHRASRRHDFQLLVEKFILQLRSGCGKPDCTTSSCFTCRKRLAGRAPIRRFTATSARTLAVYLASQDNPEDRLCPNLSKPKDPPPSLNNLIFSTRSSQSHPEFKKTTFRSPTRRRDASMDQHQQQISPSRTSSPHKAAAPPTPPSPRESNTKARRSDYDGASPGTNVEVEENPIVKDHKSFAANLFGTVAFKMVEWLTPRGIEAMSQQIVSLDGNKVEPDTHLDEETCSKSDQTQASMDSRPQSPTSQAIARETDALLNQQKVGNETCVGERPRLESNKHKPRQRSIPKSRTSKPKRAASMDTFPTPATSEDPKPTILSPRLNGFHEKPTRPKSGTIISGRGIPEVPTKPAFFENVPPPNPQPLEMSRIVSVSTEGIVEREVPTNSLVKQSKQPPSAPQASKEPEKEKLEIPAALLSNSLPQALSYMDAHVIDFMCDMFQEDGTYEKQFVVPSSLGGPCPKPLNRPQGLRRRFLSTAKPSKAEWKNFNEQTIFNVFSNPLATIQSFTQGGKLYDSHTLWYCLHRLSRVMPSLLLHCLWIAAGSLFVPPPNVRSSLPPKKSKSTRHNQTPLTDTEAGQLMSICLHALVAAVPIVPDSRTLYDMSRIRSNGLSLVGGSGVARQPPSRCLDYDDAFKNDLAIRLARRLFCAITVRRCFHDLTGREAATGDNRSSLDVLQPLVDQLDFIGAGIVPILEFSNEERNLHETRVSTILLDWSRTIILDGWTGRPEFSMDGPFGGALSFIETMYDNRNLLLLGDIQFRLDYLSDRLDAIEIPVDWQTFESTRWKRHILDYPYIFSPETLVSFFRSINFARMSRMFEESSSLKSRMSAIVDPGSLITNPHHKMVLQDLLKTASAKYLILEISRDQVVQDAFNQLWRREERELLRPLKVHLGEAGGEEGFDSGGVQQEFFRLVIAECLDPKYGAFTVDDRTRMVWFAPGSLTEEWKFELVGLLVSLALFNGVTLPITFPKALYRKLLGKPVDELHHIADGWPELASGLTTLLEWDEKDGSVEDIFALTYEFSVSAFDVNVTREMKGKRPTWPKAAAMSSESPPGEGNPSDAPMVTNDNRDTYVNDYIRYLTDVSVRPQYLAFERGFHACLNKKSLSLLNPPILQSLVEGVQDIDVSELRRYARYVGWDASHHTIRDFWSIVKRYDDRMKRRLLEFVTSSDRVPVGGMKNLQFVIQKNGEEEGEGGHLPTAYTCYGTLLLPEYRDKDVLRERLGMALENAQGFGFA